MKYEKEIKVELASLSDLPNGYRKAMDTAEEWVEEQGEIIPLEATITLDKVVITAYNGE